jgi:phosphate/phosphite/phosphonate ABC transporter binding protein
MARVWWLAILLLCACAEEPTGVPRLLDSPAAAPERAEEEGAACREGTVVPEVVRFGVTPYMGVEMVQAQFEPIVDYLAREIGRRVELVPASSYTELEEMLVRGDIHVASVSPVSYVAARRRIPCLQLLLTQVAAGSAYYSSYLLTRADSDVMAVEDLKGRPFAFTARSSASGYLFPRAFLQGKGITPETFFGRVVYGGDHLGALRMLLEGEVDAAATFSSFMGPARRAGLDVGNLRVLAVTGRIPYDAVVAHPDLAPSLAAAVQDALARLNSTTEEGRRLLGRVVDMSGWVPSVDSVYAPVRETLARVSGEAP